MDSPAASRGSLQEQEGSGGVPPDGSDQPSGSRGGGSDLQQQEELGELEADEAMQLDGQPPADEQQQLEEQEEQQPAGDPPGAAGADDPQQQEEAEAAALEAQQRLTELEAALRQPDAVRRRAGGQASAAVPTPMPIIYPSLNYNPALHALTHAGDGARYHGAAA